MLMFIVEMRPPAGPAEYAPEGFGFTAHVHTRDRAAAMRHDTRERAARWIRNYWHPPAFWESERRHAANMQRKFARWSFDIVAA